MTPASVCEFGPCGHLTRPTSHILFRTCPFVLQRGYNMHDNYQHGIYEVGTLKISYKTEIDRILSLLYIRNIAFQFRRYSGFLLCKHPEYYLAWAIYSTFK